MTRERTLSTFSLRSPVVMMVVTFLGGLLEVKFGKFWGISGLLFTVTGGLGVVYVIWCWLGRTPQARSWAVIERGPNLAIICIPLFAFMMFGGGVTVFFGLPKIIALPFGLISFMHFVLLLIGGGSPEWWGPGWYRRNEHKKGSGAKRAPHDALGTMADAYSKTPKVLSRDEMKKTFGKKAVPVAQWKGGWVHDPDTQTQEHNLARKGTVEGELAWYPEGLGFAATAREDSLRGKPNVVTIPTDQVTDVAVVPARAGADGQPRRGFWMRSPFPRLVVHTTGEHYVFDVARGRARKVATFIKEQTDQRT